MTEEISSQDLEQTTASNSSNDGFSQPNLIDIDIPPVVLKSIQVARTGPKEDGLRNDRSLPDASDLYPRMPATDLFERRSEGETEVRARVISQLSEPVVSDEEPDSSTDPKSDDLEIGDDVLEDEPGPEKMPPVKLEKYRPGSIRMQDHRKGRFGSKHHKYQKPFRISFDGLVRHFAACARCSYFLTGLRALYGDNLLADTIDEMDDSWMPMPWNIETRRLLNRSFGIRTDVGFFFIEHSCDGCQRRIVYEEMPEWEDGEKQDKREYFWIEIKARR